MTRSTGTSGFTLAGSPPSLAMPSRMAARSTTAGTPVKSCIRMRDGLNGTSDVLDASLSQSTTACASRTA